MNIPGCGLRVSVEFDDSKYYWVLWGIRGQKVCCSPFYFSFEEAALELRVFLFNFNNPFMIRDLDQSVKPLDTGTRWDEYYKQLYLAVFGALGDVSGEVKGLDKGKKKNHLKLVE